MRFCWFILCYGFCLPFALTAQDVQSLLARAENTAEETEKLTLYHQVAQAYAQQKDYQNALRYHLQVINTLEKQASPTLPIVLCESYAHIASLYEHWKAYKKVLAYLDKNLACSAEPAQHTKTIEGKLRIQLLQQDYTNALATAQTLLQIYQQTQNKTQIFKILQTISDIQKAQNDYTNALKTNQQILQIAQTAQDTLEICRTFNNLGFIHRYLNQQDQALQYFQQSVELGKKFIRYEDKNGTSFINIGVIHQYKQEFNKALSYFFQAYKIREANKNNVEMAQVCNFIANVYINMQDYENAKLYTDRAIQLAQQAQAKDVLAVSSERLSTIYERLNDYKNSLSQYKTYSITRNQIAENEKLQQKSIASQQEAIEGLEREVQLLLIEKEIKELEVQKARLEDDKRTQGFKLEIQQKELANVALRQRELEKEKALQTALLMAQDIENQKKNQAITLLEREKEIQELALKQKDLKAKERQKEIELLEKDRRALENEAKIKELEAQQASTRIRAFTGIIVVGGALFLFVLYMLWRNNKQRKLLAKQKLELDGKNQELLASEEEIKQNLEQLQATNEVLLFKEQLVHEKNKALESAKEDIIASITYAKRIQDAILPTNQEILRAFPEHFILFKPRDIVSGDFYFLAFEDNVATIAVVDCTGHGIPGAFMSLIGNDLLNDIVRLRKIKRPDDIIDELKKGVNKALRQQETHNQDGMDISICTVSFPKNTQESTKVEFAGAGNPLYFYQENSQIFERLKASKIIIGGFELKQIDTHITLHSFEIDQPTTIYLVSDGYQDQFGGESYSKLGVKKFREVLATTATLPIKEQKDYLNQYIATWQGETKQIDDILIIGIRLG